MLTKNKAKEYRKSVPHAKKVFYDWLDRNRPWAQPENKQDVYRMMEDIVRWAAVYFADEPPPNDEYVACLESAYSKLSAKVSDHTDEGLPDGLACCHCAECLSHCD